MGPVLSRLILQDEKGAGGEEHLYWLLALYVGTWVEDHGAPSIQADAPHSFPELWVQVYVCPYSLFPHVLIDDRLVHSMGVSVFPHTSYDLFELLRHLVVRSWKWFQLLGM